MTRSVVGLDVGGANLKAAHSKGGARSISFPLWKEPERLTGVLKDLVASLPDADTLAVTMTGELCDCWESKRHGVEAILDAVASIAEGRSIHVWTNQGTFVDLAAARTIPRAVASANWLALATFAGRTVPRGGALLIDLGTTTTDIIPLHDGRPCPVGRTDGERMRSGELVYLGWKRTPLCALLCVEVAAELFATMHDAFLVTNAVPEDAHDCTTADGRPATRVNALRRLARIVCEDTETLAEREVVDLATRAQDEMVTRIARAVDRVVGRMPGPVSQILTAGSGEFLLPAVLASPLVHKETVNRLPVSLGASLGASVSTAACAHAVAMLCQEV